MMKQYTRTLQLRTKNCDVNGLWRFSSILETMQEAAGDHCSALGCGRTELAKRGLAWVIVRNEIRMEQLPSFEETVTVTTFHKAVRHRFFPRYFIIQGTPNLKVAWELKAKQRDYQNIRLEQNNRENYEYEKSSDNFYNLEDYINETEALLYGND